MKTVWASQRVAGEDLVLPNWGSVSVPKCSVRFQRADEHQVSDTYGGKAVLDFDGESVFAELAILRTLQKNGWQGVWVDTFGHRTYRNAIDRATAVAVPSPQQAIYDSIAGASTMPGGCWDVFAWKEDEVLFAEAKRARRDALRPNQLHWLDAALQVGHDVESFLLVEWEFV